MARFTANVSLDGTPVRGVPVLLVLVSRSDTETTQDPAQLTDSNGKVEFEYDSDEWERRFVSAVAPGYWNACEIDPGPSVQLNLTPLPQTGPIGWWHRILGIDTLQPERGRGIKIGVVDTGISNHDSLRHIRNAGSFEGVVKNPGAGQDKEGHGTHVCGIIGARPSNLNEYWGIAPGAEVISVKVTSGPGDDGRRFQDSIARAVEHLADEESVDLINLSVGSKYRSTILHTHVRDAADQGVLCICAAGNDGGRQRRFPAAFEQTVAVSALGLAGVAPTPDWTYPSPESEADRFGKDKLFLAKFSNFGPEITCCAPGARIISASLFGPTAYQELSGTSMASPAACAALAAILATDEQYLKMPRSAARTLYAKQVLIQSCRDAGLAQNLQGSGLVQARPRYRGSSGGRIRIDSKP